MANSTINKPQIKVISGTLTDGTSDYLINNVIPNGYKAMCGRYFTTYNQYRLLQVGQSGNTLVIQNPNSSMANRPYEVFLYGGG